MIGGVIFLVGLLGLMLFTLLILWESTQDKRVFASMRSSCDRMISGAYRNLVFGEIPQTYRGALIVHVRRIVHKGVHSLASLLRAIERPLARTSRRMQHAHESGNGTSRTPSPFLKDIAHDKEKNGKNTQDSV